MTRHTTLAIYFSLLIALLAGCTTLGNILIPEVVRGSGNVIAREFAAERFSKVSIASHFSGTVQYGEAFSVVVHTDDNMMDDVKISVQGDTLSVTMARKNYQEVTEQQVIITMPVLEEIALHGVSKIDVTGFANAPAFVASVEGASQLSGDVRAESIVLTLAGASKATLAGEGKSLVLSASGLSVGNLVDLAVETAEVVLTGSSRARITASQTIAVEAGGLSELIYSGGATLTSSKIEGNSQVVEQ